MLFVQSPRFSVFPLGGTTLTLIDTVRGNIRVITSDSLGKYNFSNVVSGGFYLVVPQREGYTFNPGIYELNLFDERPNLDFAGTPNNPRPVQDFDGDGKTDLVVFRPSEGNWYILNSQNNSLRVVRFGLAGDIPLAEDYDGDHRADFAVYRPSEGTWYRLNSTDGSYTAVQFGLNGDRPIAADFDSDGRADLSVFRNGTWFRLRSSDGAVNIFQFGLAEDKPIAADFDGDGRIDTAVWRPSTGVWYWLDSSDGEFQSRSFGVSTDTPVPADYNGDGKFEQAVYRGGTWYVLRSNNSFYASQFGTTGDIPTPSTKVP